MYQTKIEWTDHTFNPWEGCQKVAPECDHCYAEARDVRFTGGTHWGPKAPRRRTSVQNWNKPRRWNAQADAFFAAHGRRQRVFCASLADVFDNAIDPAWRADLWALIQECDRLDWLLLTKRSQNIAKMLPPDWGDGWPHVWLGTTAGMQKTAEQNIPHLLATPAMRRFVSCEPMLGPVDLTRLDMLNIFRVTRDVDDPYLPKNFFDALTGQSDIHPIHNAEPNWGKLDWVICGGESGPNARPMHPTWAKSLRDQCQNAGTAFFFKQWGEYRPAQTDAERKEIAAGRGFGGSLSESGTFGDPRGTAVVRVGKKVAGRKLDGREHNGFPDALDPRAAVFRPIAEKLEKADVNAIRAEANSKENGNGPSDDT